MLIVMCSLGAVANAQELSNAGITSLSSITSSNCWFSINSIIKGGSTQQLFSGLEYPLIKEGAKEYFFSVYPNPAIEIVHINSNVELITIRIITNDGRIVIEQSGMHDINVSHLPAGAYTIEGKNPSERITVTAKLNLIR